jgi:hypothetical protein
VTIRYTLLPTSFAELPLGAKIRLALTGIGALGVLALVLSVSAALFLILAPILIVSGLVGSFLLNRKAKMRAEDGTIDVHYVVIEPDATEPPKRDTRALR